ncbi:helix-turn-helix domain-containing protein [Nonomuraea sp. NPDC046802]|uniref:helix-turn-helix domain-containing protein n=1 Tax=Nonomuraea sp. NPDC046802 TaxID=3154919 RepID=UPI00340C24F3
MGKRILLLPTLVLLRKESNVTPTDVAAAMGIDSTNVNRLEKTLSSGGGAHARTISSYVAGFGYYLSPSPEELVRHRRANLQAAVIAAAMGMAEKQLLKFEDTVESGGGNISNVIRYSEVTGQPLTAIRDENFAALLDRLALAEQAKRPSRTLEQVEKERHRLIAEARRLATEGMSIDGIAKRLKRDPSTIREYVGRPGPTRDERYESYRRLVAQAHQLHAEGKSIKAIAKLLQRHYQTIWKYLREPPPEGDP